MEIGGGLLVIIEAKGELIRDQQPHLGAAVDMPILKPRSSYELQAYM